MKSATVKYITNGYTIVSTSPQLSIPASVYAASVPEVVYWLGRLFDPFAPAGFAAAKSGGVAPAIIEPTADPLVGQQAQVETIESGGFLVRQFGFPGSGAQLVELYCASMDAVADALTQIFTPPEPVTPE